MSETIACGRLAPRGVQRGQPVAGSDDPVTPARKQLVERAQLGLALERNQDDTHASSPSALAPSDVGGTKFTRVF